MHDSVPPVITNDDNVQHQSSTSSTTASQNKKPRHRHSPAQLAALNELFDRNEHPSLDDRSSLADKLGMETKTVNAWFQNKRASTKKRNKTNPHPPPSSQVQNTPSEQDGTSSTSTNLPSISTLLNPLSGTSPAYSSTSSAHSHNNTHSHPPIFSTKEMQDYPLDNDLHHSGITTMGPEESGAALQGSFFAGTPETLPQRFFTENDVASNGRRMRMRPTSEQTEELRKAYNTNPHPSKDDREELGEKLGMRYQSITNWFQNQRSLAKKRKDDDVDSSSSSAPTSKHARTHSYYEDDQSDRRDDDSYRREHDPDRRHHAVEEHERISRTHNPSGLSSGHPVAHRSSISSLLNAEDRLSLPPSFPPSFSPFRPYPPSPRRRGNSTRRSVTPYHLSPSVFSAGRTRDLGHGVHGREHRSMSQTDSVAFERVLHPEAALTRPRRTRPEPYQLEALKKLFMRTSNPSIEERTALASEVGMDVGKVTNWFRNLRQTARKRAKKRRVAVRDAEEAERHLRGHLGLEPLGVVSHPQGPHRLITILTLRGTTRISSSTLRSITKVMKIQQWT
ncbi:hypothetical protein SERLA73DRAFT_163673 [Serpula lacrymans var. lacrymans S7.3]|uniref:Homeobox domain-containing protein n=1 Tax=Serpula lacrymans var. lacrymans (strain S7.3) TaxID=936435 RepID=F8QF07_SERL3|nr:hypothetical protein SERLA73DRAFT_163673 [Serpula lacrymans var. lacrymans S7.3]